MIRIPSNKCQYSNCPHPESLSKLAVGYKYKVSNVCKYTTCALFEFLNANMDKLAPLMASQEEPEESEGMGIQNANNLGATQQSLFQCLDSSSSKVNRTCFFFFFSQLLAVFGRVLLVHHSTGEKNSLLCSSDVRRRQRGGLVSLGGR